jgi:hypothetical protein
MATPFTAFLWLRKAIAAFKEPRLMFGARAVDPEGDPFEVISPFPLTADGLRVPVEVTGLELGGVSIEFPETQNIAGSVAVTNFPAYPAAPTTIEVSNFPAPVTTVSVDNFPDPPAVQEVTGVVGAVCSGAVAVSNFPAFPSSFAVSNFPSSQAVTGDFYPATQPVSGTVNATCSGTVNVGNFPASQAVTGTFWQATQPVSGPLTDVQLRATPLPVSGSINATCSGTVAVSGSVAVTGTFWQTTQPVSGTVSATCSGTVAVSNFPATQPVSGPLTDAQLRASAVPVTGSFSSAPQPSTLCVTATGVISASVPVVLPAPGVGLFHYITAIDIVSYAGATIATAAGAVTITTTNLPGNPVFNHQRLHTAGQSFSSGLRLAGNPLRSSVANTATTITCPVLTGCIWRVNVTYYTGP